MKIVESLPAMFVTCITAISDVWSMNKLHDRLRPPYVSLLYVAGRTLLRTVLMSQSGNELTHTMSATFHANRHESTNDRSYGKCANQR